MMRDEGRCDLYERFLTAPAVNNSRDFNAFQIRQISTEERRTPRVLSASIISNLILTVLVICTTCLIRTRSFDSNHATGEEFSTVSRRDAALNRTNICLPCRPPKSKLGIIPEPSLCCYHSNEHAILLIKLMLDQKQHKTSSLYGQYEVTPTRDERPIHFKSTLKRAPTSSIIPATANRLQITTTGRYNLFGSMCFSEKDYRGKPETVVIKLETVYSGFKKNILQKSVSVHWDPNAYIYVNFMNNIWLQKGTDVLLFVNHPNVIYDLPGCNSISIYRST